MPNKMQDRKNLPPYSADCPPSNVPRKTGLCKRYARNMPAAMVNPDEATGIRRKMLVPALPSAVTSQLDRTFSSLDHQVNDEFDEAEMACAMEMGYTSGIGQRKKRAGTCHEEEDRDPAMRLSRLIDQENRDIESSTMYIEKTMYDEGRTPKSFRELADNYKLKYNTDESLLDSEMQPELAARMLAREGQGANLKHIPPAALYGRLFPEDKSIPKIRVTAASKRRRGLVIPIRAGLQQEDQLMDDLDAGIVDYYEINTAYSKPKESEEPIPPPIKHEAEGDADQILGIAEEDTNEPEDNERKPFKYIVTSEPPLHGNYVQLRGSEPPVWFPGFFTINPGVPELQSIDEPNDALERAWGSMNPSQIKSPYGAILLGKQ